MLNELAPDHRSGVAIVAASNNDQDTKMAKTTETTKTKSTAIIKKAEVPK